MKKTLLLLVTILFVTLGYSQTDRFWSSVTKTDGIKISRTAQRETFSQDFKLMQLDVVAMKQALNSATDRFAENNKSVIISLPNSEGKIERFRVLEASNFEPELQAQFPDIRSYVGQGVDDKYAKLRLTIDPRGVNTMVSRADRPSEYMEPYSADGRIHAVYTSSRSKGATGLNCLTTDDQTLFNDLNKNSGVSRSSTGVLLNFRLAMSVTPEYTAYHGGTKPLALAAINATMARVNGVFETDFGIHMNLISNMTIIYDGSVADPYGPNDANYNLELQQTLTTIVGNANYDVGHLMAAIGNNGNAGCIGCVCVNPTIAAPEGKGSGYTTSTAPIGDNFDIDFVAHEMGHQFGGTHTFSFGNEGSGTNIEVGSGVSVMGYAGITPYDTHLHSIDTFHAASIAQVQANMASKTCPTVVAITHSAPVVNAGADWSVPLSTPFRLTGSATDAGGASAITYAWEQMNNASAAQVNDASAASGTKATGPNWVCFQDSASPVRNFPVMSSILSGNTTTPGLDVTAEALSSVARTLNFRLTARDNILGQGQTNFDDMVVTVLNKLALTVTMAPSTSYPVGSTQTVVWTGAGGITGHSSIVGGANVDISFSSDNGLTWTTLLTGTPNDGTQAVTLPTGVAALYCRFMVKASANIFFNISSPFAVGYTIVNTCNTYSGSAMPIITSAGIPANQIGTVNVPMTGSISSISVFNNLTHAYLSDVVSDISSPQNPTTFVKAYNRFCGENAGSLNLKLTTGGGALNCTAGGTTLQTVASGENLGTFNGQNPNGVWTLRVYDQFTGDNGTLNSWSIEVCTQVVALLVEDFGLENFSLYPNPNNGNFNVKFNSTSDNQIQIGVHDMRGRQILNKSFSNTGLIDQNLQLDNVQAGVYLVTVQDGNRKEVKKIVVE